MHIGEIKKAWTSQNTNPNTGVTMWDSQAEDPIYNQMPTLQNNKFLQLLDKEGMLNPTYTALDVGCGVGVYAMAVALKTRSATGVDFSPKMIEKGNQRLEQEKIANVTLACMDWATLDLDQAGFREQFDLVFAHTTPAVCDVATFLKLNDASRHFCVLSNPGKMHEPVLQAVQEIVGLADSAEDCGSTRIYALDLLLQLGYLPKLDYDPQVWDMDQPYENACSYYIGRLAAMGKQLTPQETTAVKYYLASVAKDGRVVDQIHTVVTSIYWSKQ